MVFSRRRICAVAVYQILVLLSAISANATYQLNITNRQYLNGGVSGVLDPVADSLEAQFNTAMAASDNMAFLSNVGNANAGSTRSFLAPGSTDPSKFSFGFGVSGALSGGTSTSTKANSLPAVGAAAQSGITIGANGDAISVFEGLNPKKVMYYFSFYSMDLSRFFSNGISVDSTQISLGLSYQVYNPREWMPGIRFNGIRMTSGASYAGFNGSYTAPFTISSGGVDMQSDVTLSVDSTVFTFSTEATAGVRIFYLLDLFMGLGVDFNVGTTKLQGSSSNGAVSASQGGVTVFTGDVELLGSADAASPSAAQLRWIIGTQVNLGPMGVYGQAQVSTPSVYSLNLGAKFAF
jgi:hypothetical protein